MTRISKHLSLVTLHVNGLNARILQIGRTHQEETPNDIPHTRNTLNKKRNPHIKNQMMENNIPCDFSLKKEKQG